MNHSLSLLLKTICKPNNSSGNFAIDVGAHNGKYSQFLMSSNLFDNVIAFEPNPISYSQLLNHVSSSLKCELKAVNLALSSKPGMLDLFCDSNSATASLLQYASEYINSGQIKKCKVPVTTLDEYLSNYPISGHLKVLKIDTQGNDLTVLEGAVNTIKNHNPIIQTEFIYIPLYENQCTPRQISDFLFSLDYEMYSLNNLHITSEGRLSFCDAIFIPKNLDIPLMQEYSCIDDQDSYEAQIKILTQICSDRLKLIEQLDTEVKRLNTKTHSISRCILQKVKSWVQ